jgi:hypothetical protein
MLHLEGVWPLLNFFKLELKFKFNYLAAKNQLLLLLQKMLQQPEASTFVQLTSFAFKQPSIAKMETSFIASDKVVNSIHNLE